MDYENDSIIWFKDGKSYDNHILGGKGAGLCMMTQLDLPVPPGFIIPTTVCNEFYKNSQKLPKTLMNDVKNAIQKLESITGKKFGGSQNPLLVSARSGASKSMPGMIMNGAM